MFFYTYIILLIILNIFLFINIKTISFKLNIFDNPDKLLKIHKIKTPVLGGVFIYINILIYLTLFILFQYEEGKNIFTSNKTFFNFFFFGTIFFLIGIFDDKYKIKANSKLVLFTLAIYISILLDKNLVIDSVKFSFLDKEFFLENFSIFFTVLCILLFINAFNMFDGINCQTGCYSVFIFIILLINGMDKFLVSSFIVPLLFFIIFNFTGKTFLGNSGSYMLPLLISYLLIISYNNQIFLADEVIFILFFPGIDMLRLFIERIYNGRNPFEGDKNHIHHILLKKFGLFQTLFLTVGFKVVLYSIYILSNINMIFFLILIVLYYMTIYFSFKKKYEN